MSWSRTEFRLGVDSFATGLPGSNRLELLPRWLPTGSPSSTTRLELFLLWLALSESVEDIVDGGEDSFRVNSVGFFWISGCWVSLSSSSSVDTPLEQRDWGVVELV